MIQFRDQLAQLEFFSLYENVVALEILVLLLGQDQVQPVIQLRDLIVNLPFAVFDFKPLLRFVNRLGTGARGVALAGRAEFGRTADVELQFLRRDVGLLSRQLAGILRFLTHYLLTYAICEM